MDDESAPSIISGRKKYASRLTKPFLVMDNLNNAPPSGAYLLVHYPGEVGPQHVDWFWQPESLARRPDDALVLFDRADLQVVSGDEWRDEMYLAGGRSPINETDQASIVTFKITFFWTMSLIVANYIALADRVPHDGTITHWRRPMMLSVQNRALIAQTQHSLWTINSHQRLINSPF